MGVCEPRNPLVTPLGCTTGKCGQSFGGWKLSNRQIRQNKFSGLENVLQAKGGPKIHD